MSEIEFDLDRVYSYLYIKFNFFNNLKNRELLNFSERFNLYYMFIYQG